MPLMRRFLFLLAALAATLCLLSCSSKPDAATLVMLIESSPTNLDPRIGVDAQSERIDNLIFDDLLSRGDNLDVAPGLAERWEIPDPLTYVFHLHQGVKFHDGRPLTVSRCEVDFRFAAARKDSQHESRQYIALSITSTRRMITPSHFI